MSERKKLGKNSGTGKSDSVRTDRNPRKRKASVRIPSTAELALDVRPSRVCKNAACRAFLSPNDVFCKRCSCCICHLFDDNKDPSLWLVCESGSDSQNSCGLSCHLECAYERELMRQDGNYCCAGCGKVTCILECWKNNLIKAKDARRVDILCYRISVCYRLLNGTSRFREFHDLIRDAKAKLETDVGPWDGMFAKMNRRIVGRLPSACEVQKLISLAIENAESWLGFVSNTSQNFSEGSSSGFKGRDFGGLLLQARAGDELYSGGIPRMPEKEARRSQSTSLRDINDELIPSGSHREEENVRTSGPIVDEAEKNLGAGYHGNGNSQNCSNSMTREVSAVDPRGGLDLNRAFDPPWVQVRVSDGLGSSDEFENYVKTMRRLEQEHLIDAEFRLKMLTWIWKRATQEQRRVVSTFIRVLGDDPSSLAAQLVDTFRDIVIPSKKPKNGPDQ